MVKVTVKLYLCFFNWVPRHESVLAGWRYSSTHSWSRHYIEVSGQFHAPAALSPGKDSPPLPRYPLDSRLGGHQSLSGRGDEEKNSQYLAGHPSHSLALYRWANPAPNFIMNTSLLGLRRKSSVNSFRHARHKPQNKAMDTKRKRMKTKSES